MAVSREEVKERAGETNDGVEEEEADDVVLRWEKFLPKMDIRVLLVESDDSTRHIITALLEKCRYQVTAFSDGLKAWEVLNGRSHNIDLVLTEVEVPSISGFSLLTLVAEHEVCRNVPVIMMSAHDSVSTVYNCMLKGATDFLVKPIRKNELNNLWQHVWRRQVNSCRLENLEAKQACLEHKHDLTQPKQRKSPSSDIIIPKDEHEKERASMHDGETQRSMSVPKTNSDILLLGEDMAADDQCERANITAEAFDYDNNNALDNSSRKAMDLIGTFNTDPECSYRSLDSTYGLNKLDSSLLLELSLKLSHPRGSLNQVTDDRHGLKQSDASAFSRYNSRTFQPLHTSDNICDQERVHETNFDIQLTHQAHEYSSGNSRPLSPTSDRLGIQFPRPQQVIPVTVPEKCASFERLCNVYSNLTPPLFCTQSSQPPLQSLVSSLQTPVSSGNHDPSIQVNKNCPVNPGITNSKKILQYLMDQNIHNASTLIEHEKYELEPIKDQARFPFVIDQHVSGGFCNGISNRFNNINSGSNGTRNAVQLVKVAAENGNEASLSHDEKYNRSIQREAALTKFRMKRKARCFDKKVRYQSRSKLAEKRPRVKGQFVRQVQTEAIALESDEQGC